MALETYRRLCRQPAEAVRWACILEATAPKVGNVYPGRSFKGLSYEQFVSAAEITASALASCGESFSEGVLEASRNVAERIGTNVNLGILLLLGPLVRVDKAGQLSDDPRETIDAVAAVLNSMSDVDSKNLYEAINVAAPGGMGRVSEMDLLEQPPQDFLEAMRSARHRDRIAENYAEGFKDLLEVVVPLLTESITENGDLLLGVARAHLVLLRHRPDTLIERKFGADIAQQVRRRAGFDHDDLDLVEAFDHFLRTSQDRPVNPGTTADLIAAGLYILLRSDSYR